MASRAKQVAEQAVGRFLRDWRAQGGHAVADVVVVDHGDHGISIGTSGEYPSVLVLGLSQLQVARDVIDHVHAEMVSDEGQQGRALLPFCPSHGTSLHAQAVEDRLMWWCGEGAHSPAAVGKL